MGIISPLQTVHYLKMSKKLKMSKNVKKNLTIWYSNDIMPVLYRCGAICMN